MKRTDLDRLRIIAALCKGEDVKETCKSESTAYTEYRKMSALMNATYWRVARPCWSIAKYGERSQSYSEVLGIYGKVDDEVLSLMGTVEGFLTDGSGCNRASEYVSVEESEFLCANGEPTEPHFSLCFRNRTFSNKSGTYTVVFSDAVNTSKRKAWNAYGEAVARFVQEVGLMYAPDKPLFKMKYGSTESSLRKSAARVLDMIGEHKSEPCTEKQAFHVSKNMGVGIASARKLNKAQASELLGCIFGGDDNEISRKVHDHYEEVLRKL